jgi:hypothetical protein
MYGKVTRTTMYNASSTTQSVSLLTVGIVRLGGMFKWRDGGTFRMHPHGETS